MRISDQGGSDRRDESGAIRHVLVVDDDPVARALERDIFAIEGWQVTLAGTVQEGWQAAVEGDFDVIVCDLGLPDGDGLELVAAWRRHPTLAAVPVVVVTGRSGGGQVAAALEAGATDYLVKPFDAEELLARCWSVIRSHDLRMRLESSERQLRHLADSTADLVFAIRADGTVRYVSPSVSSLLGWEPEELVDRPARDLFDPPPTKGRPGDPPARDRRRVRRADGQWMWIDSVERVVETDDVQRVEIVIWGRDMTAQMLADQRLGALTRARHAILAENADSRGVICSAARRVSGAMVAVLLEPGGDDGLVVSSAAGAHLDGLEVPLDDSSLAARAFRACDVCVASDVAEAGPADDRLWSALPGPAQEVIAEEIYVPVVGPKGPVAVMALALGAPHGRIDRDLLEVLRLLASDAALAIEREDSSRLLVEQVHRDVLTGLVNRRILDQALDRALDEPEPVALALLDLDQFKVYNDTHGRLAGDLLLVTLAEAWSRLLRAGDTLARYGGEEFAVVMPDTRAEAAAERVGAMMEALPLGVTASAGVSEGGAGVTVEMLMARADAALRRAKREGGDRTVVG